MEDEARQPKVILEKLISARSADIARAQELQTKTSKAVEKRGKAQLATLRKTLPKDWITVLDKVNKIQGGAGVTAQARLKKIPSKKTVASSSRPATAAPQRPGPVGSLPVSTGTIVASYSASYMVLYDNGAIVYQGVPINIDQGFRVNGKGSGLYGVEEFRESVVADWWFQYSVPVATSYNHAIFIPFSGNYSVVSDDGFWTSKAAHVSLNLQAQGFQANAGAIVPSNVLDVNEQNVNLQGVSIPRLQSMSYYELLNTGEAYLRVSALYYVYARGSGSYAEFNLVNLDLGIDAPVFYMNQ